MNRDIYEYWNGKNQVKGDPRAIMRKFIVACGGDYRGAIRQAFPRPYPEDPAAAAIISQAQDRLYAAIRSSFNLIPFEQDGVTEEETYRTLKDFMSWWSKKKMSTASMPTSPIGSGSQPEKSTTNTCAASG